MSYTAVVSYNDILKNNNCEDFIKPLRKLLKPELENLCSMLTLDLANKNTQKTESSTVREQIFSITTLKNLKVFIDTAKEDREVADKFKTRLNNQHIETTYLNPQPDNPSATFKDLKGKLSSCDIVFLFYDKSPLSWLKERLRYYRVIQIRRHEPIRHIFICSPQPKILDKLPKNAVWKKPDECFKENLNYE
jgi:hypothetical protein